MITNAGGQNRPTLKASSGFARLPCSVFVIITLHSSINEDGENISRYVSRYVSSGGGHSV